MSNNQKPFNGSATKSRTIPAGVQRTQSGMSALEESDYERGLRETATGMSGDVAKALALHEISVVVGSGWPEEISLGFDATPLAGSINHTANAALRIVIDAGHNALFVHDGDGNDVFITEAAVHILLEADGDRESQGLLENLVELGERLKPFVVARRRHHGG